MNTTHSPRNSPLPDEYNLIPDFCVPLLFAEQALGPYDVSQDCFSGPPLPTELTGIQRTKQVIAGRHKEAFNNIGNRRFRVTVSLFLERYLIATTKQDKSMIIMEIVDIVNSNGRFLKRRKGNWVELDEKEAKHKVGHALRDMVVARNLVKSAKSKCARSSLKKSSVTSPTGYHVTTDKQTRAVSATDDDALFVYGNYCFLDDIEHVISEADEAIVKSDSERELFLNLFECELELGHSSCLSRGSSNASSAAA